MKEEQKQELIKFLTIHAYPKIAADIKYIEKIKEMSNQVKDKKTPYKHVLEEFKNAGSDTAKDTRDIAEFTKAKNSKGILPIFFNLDNSLLDKLVFSEKEPVAYLIATKKNLYENWKNSKKGLEEFYIGRIGLEIFE